MVSNKSLDEVEIIAALLHDVHIRHGLVFNITSLRNTTKLLRRRVKQEGLGFLTKTLPRLGKAFDKALSGGHPLNSTVHNFAVMRNSELPMFMGEFFSRVLRQDGVLLPDPCVSSVRVIREITYLFYKYELPYTNEQEQQVLSAFKKTEQDLTKFSEQLRHSGQRMLPDMSAASEICTTSNDAIAPDESQALRSWPRKFLSKHSLASQLEVVRGAQDLLTRLLLTFDPLDITPRHGPGAVATRQRLHGKYLWSNVSDRITEMYPFDEYFCSSMGHVCDTYSSFSAIGNKDLPARVILVPKDSRGPRLISCEPVDFQWIQQGLGSALVQLVERHKLTKFNVFFTDQAPNQRGALLGSSTGRYATLDLKEASDRISLDLVRLLFPKHVLPYLEACRSSSTVLPSGEVIKLNKYAPMGSCLCFPILALTVWAILTAAAPDGDTRDGILVYGDDVIVPTHYASNAMTQLESFGLLVNRDKSCTSGLFRESCGTDAFKGVDVTPVRLRTVWQTSRSPDSYTSWIAYANSFYDRRYYTVYDYIVERLLRLYGPIPDKEMSLTVPSLREVPIESRPKRKRWNKHLQKMQFYVYDIKSPSVTHEMNGWSMLLRYFTEGSRATMSSWDEKKREKGMDIYRDIQPFSVRRYTSRNTSMLVKRWR